MRSGTNEQWKKMEQSATTTTPAVHSPSNTVRFHRIRIGRHFERSRRFMVHIAVLLLLVIVSRRHQQMTVRQFLTVFRLLDAQQIERIERSVTDG